MPARAGAYDRRSPNNGNFAVIPMCASQFLGDLANDRRLGFLGVNNVIDELKGLGVGGGSLHRHNPDSLVSDNNLVAFFYIEKLNGSRSTFFLLNRYCAVDDSRRHFDLLTGDANKRLLIGGYVEVGRENAVSWSWGSLGVCALQHFSPLLPKPQDELVQCFTCFSRDFD